MQSRDDPVWRPPTVSGALAAHVAVPGSKSEANRALLLAALGDGPSRLRGVPASRDTSLMADGLAGLGAQVTIAGAATTVTPPAAWRGADIDCGLAGTVMRFLPPVAMLADGPTRFRGDARASERPLTPLLDALRALGATIHADALPFELTPPKRWASGPVVIDSSASSQFVSGLLLAGASYPDGLDLRHDGPPLPSRPHIAMTMAMLRARGIDVVEPQPDHWLVQPGPLHALDAVIEPDLTNAAAFLAAGVATRGRVAVADWPATTNQPGDLIRPIIESLGGWARRGADGALSAGADGPLTAAAIDLSAASELTPVVSALVAVAGAGRITGVGHIRGHETDRLAAIAEALTALGAAVEVDDDGLEIRAGRLHGGVIDSQGDHRLVHMAAVLGLVTPGITVTHPEAVAKTMPDFLERWDAMARPGADSDAR